jgi:hypothetical protein
MGKRPYQNIVAGDNIAMHQIHPVSSESHQFEPGAKRMRTNDQNMNYQGGVSDIHKRSTNYTTSESAGIQTTT